MRMVTTGVRYGLNLVDMVSRHKGPAAGLAAGMQFVVAEGLKLPKVMYLRLANGPDFAYKGMPRVDIPSLTQAMEQTGTPVVPYQMNLDELQQHMSLPIYPANYAAGPMAQMGQREQKLIEYYVSLKFLDIKSSDVVIDVASEWSLFPAMVREKFGATVYQQDLIYPSGVHGDKIGGSAANMPVPDGFADKIVLHNAIEHFEGTADTGLLAESFRVLKPGGVLCILPLFLSDRFANVSDPLVDRSTVTWDSDAERIDAPMFHNRFGRYYDAAAAKRRLLNPARDAGFDVTVYEVTNTRAAHPQAYLRFALVLRKPA